MATRVPSSSAALLGPTASDSHQQAAETWRRAVAGLAAAVLVARPLVPSESAVYAGGGLPLAVPWLVLAGLWALDRCRRSSSTLRWTAIDAAVAVLIGWHSASALGACLRAAPGPAWCMLWEWAALGASFFVLRQLLVAPRERTALVLVMAAVALGEAATGLHQYFVTLPATRAAYAADPEAVLRDANQWYPPGSRERWLFEQRLASVEPLGTFALTNSLAGFLVPWMLCAPAVLLWRGRGGQTPRWPAAAFALVFLLVTGACLLLSKSRTALVALAVGGLLLAWLGRGLGVRLTRRTLVIGGGAVIVLVAAAVLVGGLDRQVVSEIPLSLGYRWQYWQATLAIVADHPLFGCGPGNFGDVYTRYKLPTASEEIADPHNWLLEIAATAGLPALLAAVGVVAAVVFRWRRRDATVDGLPRTQGESAPPWYIFVGGAGGFVLAAVAGPLIDFQLPAASVVAGIALVALVALVERSAARSADALRAATAAALIAMLVNLSAAGGVGFPGVAGSLWCLLALLTVELDDQGSLRSSGRRTNAAILAAATTLLVACYFWAYRPLIAAQAVLARSQAATDNPIPDLLAAVEHDRWSTDAWVRLADAQWQAWQTTRTPAAWNDYQHAIEQATTIRPQSSALWLRRGAYAMSAYRLTADPVRLDEAVASFTRSVELYPHQADRRAQLAQALATAGRPREAGIQAEIALNLSAQTPHQDQKLPAELASRLELLRNEGAVREDRSR